MISTLVKSHTINWLLASFLLFQSGLLVAANSRSNSLGEETCVLTIAMSNWMPYQSVTQNGKAIGLQVDLLEQIVELAGCQLTYKSMPFPRGLKQLESGGVDLMINASYSKHRSTFANYSIPYRVEFQSLYSTKVYLAKCQTMTLEELIRDGFRLALERQVIYGEELRKIQQTPELNDKLFYFENIIQHFDLVKNEKLDGVIDDPVVMAYRGVIHNAGDELTACPIQVSASPVSFIFSKKTVSPLIVERFNRAIRLVKKTSNYAEQWVW